jgi:acyl-CoA reductase-like NAD-dependent aldehyde dehydrogenase
MGRARIKVVERWVEDAERAEAAWAHLEALMRTVVLRKVLEKVRLRRVEHDGRGREPAEP